MDDRIIINSELIEEKIQSTYKVMEILDDLCEKLLRIYEEGVQNEKADLIEMLREIKQMRYDTEVMYDLLKNFVSSIEDMMFCNKRKLDELEKVIAEIFV